MWSYYLLPVLYYGSYQFLSDYFKNKSFMTNVVMNKMLSNILLHVTSFSIAYFPTYFQTSSWCFKDGYRIKSVQNHWIWRYFRRYFSSTIELEEPLDPKQLYIFCVFPHGAVSANHVVTMTNCNEMLTKHYPSERRDLAATVLFFIPFVKDILLFLGCVDAGAKTAHYNLKKNHSIFIYIGGEKEQLMTAHGEQKIYVKNRKGFVKLALQYGAHLVPVYCFGENECYYSSKLFMGFRKWLQHNFHLGIPICFGRWGTPFPNKVPIHVEIGKPLKVDRIEKGMEIKPEQVDEVHSKFLEEMKRLFDRTKVKYDEYKSSELIIH